MYSKLTKSTFIPGEIDPLINNNNTYKQMNNDNYSSNFYINNHQTNNYHSLNEQTTSHISNNVYKLSQKDDKTYSHYDLMLSSKSNGSSTGSSHEFMQTLTEKLSDDQGASLFATICNMLPVLQGSATFAMPYAVMSAGLAFLPVGVVLCIIADITGCLMVDCLYEVSSRSNQRKRVRASYVEIGEDCWGIWGRRLVNGFNVCYIVVNNAIMFVLLGKCLYELLGDSVNLSESQLVMVFSVLFVPPLFINKLSLLAYLSMVGVVCVIVSAATCMIVFVMYFSQWSFESITFNYENFPFAFSILMYSTMMNCIVPQVEGSMRNSKQIGMALHISYSISTIFKLVFGAFGALSFGLNTNQLVTLNVAQKSLGVKYISMILLSIYPIADVSLMFFVVFEQLDEVMSRKISQKTLQGRKYNTAWKIFSRIMGIVVCVIIALMLPYFALLAGIVGAVTGTFLIFIFPVVFHLQLKWKFLSYKRILMEVAILIIGIFFGLLSVYGSTNALVTVFIK